MNYEQRESPLDVKISFEKLVEKYRTQLSSKKELVRDRAQQIVDLVEKYPILLNGVSTKKELKKYEKQIDFILEDLFTEVLGSNEIKVATIPFQDVVFRSSSRYKKILADAGAAYVAEIGNFSEDHHYIMACSVILNNYYGYNLDFRRPFYYDIPDKNGLIRNYKILYNGDFIAIEKKEEAKDISEEDVAQLLDNFDNVAVWKEKFPPGSWLFKGFALANIFDATMDVALSDFKAKLLQNENKETRLNEEFERIFRTLFNINDVKIGFSDYNEQENTFEKLIFKDVRSHILGDRTSQLSSEALCDTSYYTLFKQNEFYCVSNSERYHKMYPQNILYKKLVDQNVQSAIFAAIIDDGRMLGILELVSETKNALNSINANKLRDIMPFLSDSVSRSKANAEKELELIIQEECTSIHKSVHWKFRKEAQRVAIGLSKGKPTFFREVVFEDVFPLFGQIDIKGSSEARNVATQKDLELQLFLIQEIIKKVNTVEQLPIYEQIQFRITDYLESLHGELEVDSERKVLLFLRKEIIPLFSHLSKKNDSLKELINDYKERVENTTGLVYKHRRDYDETVMEINKRLAGILDAKQKDAQLMYPHYFERFKTDGVEHNLYIGESITKKNSFHKVYLYNLRLWQLQVMCEMENSYYKMKSALPIQLDVASMILAFNSSLSLRFRMDEKRFDVDGTYNARYEVVKKRVDKAHIKGTDERITQAGKIAIIYSQKEDEREYLKYIEFLQSKKYLDADVEILELEDLQGVTGLKALRVSVLYSSTKNDKEYYTYEDLMEQITS